MDHIDSAQAREQVEMIERILAASSQRLYAGGEYFLVWGLYSALVAVLWQLIYNDLASYWALTIAGVALVAAIVFSTRRARSDGTSNGRRSLLQREFLNVLYLTLGLAFVANFACFHLFSGWGQVAIWSFAEAVVVFYIGMHGNRRAQIAGILIIVSMAVANFVDPTIAGYVLASGMVFGYAGFGLSEMLARD
jgi:hypothetical protein